MQSSRSYALGMVSSPSPRTDVRRRPDRAAYDRAAIDAVLDEGFVCHVGLVDADGVPVVIPTLYCRIDDHVYLHGSPASRMLRALKSGVEVCVSVTLVDGLVLARSAFHHSVNYRSVVLFGRANVVDDHVEKQRVFGAFVERTIPGRGADAREVRDDEARKTLLLSLPITEASAKARSGPPVDDEDDLALPIWAGVLPRHDVWGAPVPDEHVLPGVEVPDYVAGYSRQRVVAPPSTAST